MANTNENKNAIEIKQGDVLVIDAATSTVLGAFADREIAIDAITDARNNGEWCSVVVIAECTDNEEETDELVDEYRESLEV